MRNPYALDRVPAGSSGGTAAAITANFGAVGLGTNTGNSIRGPSSHTSLVGIRWTMGVTSRAGIVPLFLNRDIGRTAKTASSTRFTATRRNQRKALRVCDLRTHPPSGVLQKDPSQE
jgi:Asp-tRNA(Asn)/Glu-tRNA(Gln) amidotransferase A subunit family amidase